jgi:hypothetical protein
MRVAIGAEFSGEERHRRRLDKVRDKLLAATQQRLGR